MVDMHDVLGLIGVALAIFCYTRLQWHRDYAKQLSYSLLNFLGTILIIISLLNKWNLAAFISNAVWGLVSLYGVYRCLKYMRR
jgi:hypothetical protein